MTDGRRQTDRRTDMPCREYYSTLHCQQCGRAVKTSLADPLRELTHTVLPGSLNGGEEAKNLTGLADRAVFPPQYKILATP